ncbi:MAG: 1-phosphofructokinase [Cellulomonadaceae bacterium]|nr:1-phosphofructokinase [Cellulomonadaceae bacterium]
MILTVTLNPSLDRTLEVEQLLRGHVLRASDNHLDPGGKGVNVTRALLANGVASRAVLPVGPGEGAQLVDLLAGENVATLTVPVKGRTRSNVTVAEIDGTVTKINEPGPVLSPAELDAVADAAVAASEPGGWVVLCGSLPPGAPADLYAQMVRRIAAAGVRVAVDTSGPALALAVAAGPDLVKPNAEELAEAVGRPLDSRTDVVEAAQELRAAGARRVLVSLGSAGAILVDEDGVTVGTSVVHTPRSTVGAGDAFLAGFLSAHDQGGAAALATALSWGCAAVQLPGTQMPGPDDIDPASARVLAADSLDELLEERLVGTG